MTEKQKKFAERLKNYSEKSKKYNYMSVMEQAQNDEKFANLISTMTVGRLVGDSTIEKHRFDFKYRG